MKLLAMALLIMLIGGTLVYALTLNPGYVMLAWGERALETTFIPAILALLVLWLLVRAFLRLAGVAAKSLQPVKTWQDFRYKRWQQRQLDIFNAAYQSFLVGDYSGAAKRLKSSMAEPNAAEQALVALNYEALGEPEQADNAIALAVSGDKKNQLAMTILQAEILLKRQQYDTCQALLVKHHDVLIKNAKALKLYQKVAIALKDWELLIKLSAPLKKYKIASLEESKVQVRQALVARFDALLESLRQEQGEVGLEKLQQFWQELPKTWQQDTQVIERYALGLLKFGGDETLYPLLRQQLNLHWSEKLVHYYGLCNTQDKKHLALAETWLKERPNDSVLLLSLGRIAMRQQLWEKAKSYFELSLKLSQTNEVLAELARLYEALGQKEQAQISLRRLAAQSVSLPKLPLPA